MSPVSARRTDLPFLEPVPITDPDRATAHMLAALLLAYPSPEQRAETSVLRTVAGTLPAPVADAVGQYLDAADDWDLERHEAAYVETFDLKRRCALYLSYFSAGDTRRRGMALVTFVEAYRACGWEPPDDELPDHLPSVLLGSHRQGIEVLRSALHAASSPYAHLLDAVCLTLPAVDQDTAARFTELIAAGPPQEMVGLSAPLLPFPTTRPAEATP
jgi:nitrate reductase delta subunit